MAKLNKVREELSRRFLEALNMGELPWHSCWRQALPQNAVTGRKYHGVNALWLSYLAEERGWSDPRWATYKQAAEKGWQVRRGEKASYVEYWAYYDREEKKLLSWPDARKIFRDNPEYAEVNLQLSSRVFAVFNGAQMDGIPELAQVPKTDIGQIRQQRDTLIANMGIGYKEQGQQAYYSHDTDTVTLPPEATFESTYGYMATFLHECGHASGHEARLNRDLSGTFGSENYAKEELRAEIASAFTVQALGLTVSERDRELETRQHMAYVQSWAQAIQDAPEELFRAMKDAEKISDYLIEQGEFQPILDRAAQQELAASPLEQKLAALPDNTLAVLQINPDRDEHQMKFMGMDFFQSKGLTPQPSWYDMVYSAPIPPHKSRPELLEQIYTKFNTERPEGYMGHSLSVSDIVVLKESGHLSCHFVDSIGFQELPQFTQQFTQQTEYFHFYYRNSYLFTATGEPKAQEVIDRLSNAYQSHGYFWTDDGEVVKSSDKMAQASILFDADSNAPRVYQEVTPSLIEQHLDQSLPENKPASRICTNGKGACGPDL